MYGTNHFGAATYFNGDLIQSPEWENYGAIFGGAPLGAYPFGYIDIPAVGETTPPVPPTPPSGPTRGYAYAVEEYRQELELEQEDQDLLAIISIFLGLK